MGLFSFLKSIFAQADENGIVFEDEEQEEEQEEQHTAPPPLTPEIIEQIKKEIKEKGGGKPKKPKNSYLFSIVGTYYRGWEARDRVEDLKPGEKLILKKDRKNRHSKTALRVFTEDGLWIGYVMDSSSERIWNDMEGEEGDAEYFETVHDVNEYYYTDDEGVEHERTYDNGYDHRAIYIIPNYEEKQKVLKQKKDIEKAMIDIQTAEGRMEPVPSKYEGLSADDLKKENKKVRDKLRLKKKKMESGEISEGPIKELCDIQIANLEKTLQMIEDKLKDIQ